MVIGTLLVSFLYYGVIIWVKPMNIKPTGYFVLVEVVKVDETHEGTSIIMVSDEHKRETGGRDIAHVKAFGPIAYKGYEGCDSHKDWGVDVGDLVEFNRYDGKVPRHAETNEELKNLRLIIDSDIIAVVEE